MDQPVRFESTAGPAAAGSIEGTLHTLGRLPCISLNHLLTLQQELSDKIAPVQLTIEEVNDQAARLTDSGVPLSHAILSRLDDLNSRHVCLLLFVKELKS